ncbi:MAG: GNAT family N-acetyltransferase [Candidatus Sericytochromatia bacterium]
MINYTDNIDNLTPDKLKGFFVGWANPPSAEKHIEILKNSSFVIIAKDITNNNVVGFINALTDKVLYAYIPLLEVLPEYQGKGIGKKLLSNMLEKLENYYAIDLCCDDELETFYKKFSFDKVLGMVKRNYKK